MNTDILYYSLSHHTLLSCLFCLFHEEYRTILHLRNEYYSTLCRPHAPQVTHFYDLNS